MSIFNREEIQDLLSRFQKSYQLIDEINQSTFLISSENYSTYILKIFEKDSFYKNNFDSLIKLDHSGLPKFLEVIETEKFYIVIREFIPGKTLRNLIDRNSLISEEKSIIWIKQLTEILDYLNKNKFLHRDIKPGNLIIDNNERLNLIDFGSIKSIDEIDSIDFNVIGTKKYTAPERYLRLPATIQTDIYSFGCTCFNLLTGISPNEIKPKQYYSYWKMKYNLRRIKNKIIRKIIKKCIAYNPKKRYQDFSQILEDLERL